MRAAIKWGTLTGAVTYLVIRVALTLLSIAIFGNAPADPQHPALIILGCLGLFAMLFMFSAAGYFTGRDTLRPALGAVAGMISLAVNQVLTLIYSPGAAPSTTRASSPSPIPVVGQFLLQAVAGLLVFSGAALMGWLGGRPGAQNARKKVASAKAAADAGNAKSVRSGL